MTLVDVKNYLYAHFLGQSIFSLETDLNNIKLVGVSGAGGESLEPHKVALFRAALVDMEKSAMIFPIDVTRGIYMLTQPMGSWTQTVTISPLTATLIADTFNIFAHESGMLGHVASKFAISDAEINAVIRICLTLKEENEDLRADLDSDFDDSDGSQQHENN